jgi:two-component system NtrC family sensor kinase
MSASLPISPSARAPGLRSRVLSIRTKGMLVFAALIAYSALIAFFAFYQKNLLLRDFEAIQGLLETESMLKETDVATFHAVMALFANADAAGGAARTGRIRQHYQSLLARQAALAPRLPDAYLKLQDMQAAWDAVSRDPSRANMNRMVAELVETTNGLATLTEQVQANRKAASVNYRAQADSTAMTALMLGLLGLGLLGAIIGLFFRRLSEDLRLLQSRALEIVKGFRGAPLQVTRQDEVGRLMVAVNNMAEILDQHEKEEILKRQKYFHQEKMAAIGALAAGVAHEIGNPIAAICGIAQEMVARRAAGGANCSAACYDCRPDLIYAQTERLAATMREIAEFASPRAAEPQFLDLNAQMRSATSLIRYDRRLQQVSLQLALDTQLPAIYGVADQITQLVMNLLINAVDACEGVSGRARTITISTHAEPQRACLVIEDNGAGMDAATRERAFEAFFTTKPAGKGTGLGLSLCYAITSKHGASIEIDSTLGAGTRVQVAFPLTVTDYNEANSA